MRWWVVARKRDQAAWLSQLLTEWARVPVTVGWESGGVGRGDWWVRWSDGPAVQSLRAQAGTYAPHMRPLDVTSLRWGRLYSPRAWALALLTVAETQPGITDWHELLGAAESWLDDADWPERAVDDAHAEQVERLVAAGGGRESAMARAALAGPHPAETESRDETVCPVCGGQMRRAGVGRPARYCSPACRTRGWRRRAASGVETESRDETACPVCGGRVASHTGAGRPARYCSSACRTRAWRHRSA
jgi:hypothetical protein